MTEPTSDMFEGVRVKQFLLHRHPVQLAVLVMLIQPTVQLLFRSSAGLLPLASDRQGIDQHSSISRDADEPEEADGSDAFDGLVYP